MSEIDWRVLASLATLAKPGEALWTLAVEYVSGPSRLRIRAVEGTWSFGDDLPLCGADGDSRHIADLPKRLIPTAPTGCLCAKIGGSIVGKDDGKLFVIGSFCILDLDSSMRGPLYLTINDDPAEFGDNSGEINVEVADALT